MSDNTTSRPARTHAVALRYDANEPAPKVIAKGYGHIADAIIQTATANGLHIHESKELVALLMQINLDEQIPAQLYQVVAELLAWVYSIENLDATPLIPTEKNPKA